MDLLFTTKTQTTLDIILPFVLMIATLITGIALDGASKTDEK